MDFDLGKLALFEALVAAVEVVVAHKKPATKLGTHPAALAQTFAGELVDTQLDTLENSWLDRTATIS